MAQIPKQNLEYDYYLWLYGFVGAYNDKNPEHSYTLLIERLHETQFRWSVDFDDNRERDGVGLRSVYLREAGDLDRPSDEILRFISGTGTVMEVILALCRQINFIEDCDPEFGRVGYWFWRLIDNLGLLEYTDENIAHDPNALHEIDVILELFLDRKYDFNGQHGGLFPLASTEFDQRTVELWYQMHGYLEEMGFDEYIYDF